MMVGVGGFSRAGAFLMKVLIFLLFFVASSWAGVVMPEEGSPVATPECDIHHAPCTKIVQECELTLDIRPKPVKAMEDLIFTVTVSGAKPTSDPYVDLGMPGMNMGPNRVSLRAAGQGRYEGKGVIVRCPSGRRTWQATVTIPGTATAEFIFDVIY
jgi:hypothetical protein